MVEFVEDLIRPSYDRAPLFSGHDTSGCYRWSCACGAEVSLPLDALIRSAYSWKTDLATLQDQITSHFQLNVVGKSHDGGWPSVVQSSCAACDVSYLLYSGVQETSNSVYRITIQGLVRTTA